MCLLHCVAIFYNLPWFFSIKVSNKKSHRNVENSCGVNLPQTNISISKTHDTCGKFYPQTMSIRPQGS